jgi:hypothetical protein
VGEQALKQDEREERRDEGGGREDEERQGVREIDEVHEACGLRRTPYPCRRKNSRIKR